MNDAADHADPDSIRVWIYRGARRADTYIYLPAPDDFENVPEDLRAALGRLELVLEVDLNPQRALARADPVAVIRSVRERGYYLQLPPVEPAASSEVH